MTHVLWSLHTKIIMYILLFKKKNLFFNKVLPWKRP